MTGAPFDPPAPPVKRGRKSNADLAREAQLAAEALREQRQRRLQRRQQRAALQAGGLPPPAPRPIDAPAAGAGRRPRPLPEFGPLAYPIIDVAAAAHVSVATLYRDVKKGKLAVTKIGNRTVVTKAELDRYLTGQTSQ